MTMQRTREEKMAIADEILKQLGGHKFVVMTGARNLITSDEGLSFRIPGTYTKNHVNVIRIFLTWDDRYTVMYENLRGTKRKIISHHEGLYNDQLQADFTAETGLDTRL